MSIQNEIQIWTAPENRTEVLEALAAVTLALAICGISAAAPTVADLSNVGSEVSPSWSAYVVDRIAAGDIGCDDPHYVRVGTADSVWMNYPHNFGVSPSGGAPDREAGDALHKAHTECIKRRDQALFETPE